MTDLYSKFAQAFDNTRQAPWVGWQKLSKSYLTDKTILDLGSGNSRFLKFLHDSKINYIQYLGVDNSNILLANAQKYILENHLEEKCKTLNIDLESEWDICSKFNTIVSFGFTHHLTTTQARDYFFEEISKLLEDNGVLIVSFWDFKNYNIYKNAKLLSENLYELSFGGNAKRDCYYFSNDEIYELINKYNFEIIDKFLSDSKDNKGNRYFVCRKSTQGS